MGSSLRSSKLISHGPMANRIPQKKIKDSSFVGVAATPLKPLPSCYRVKWKGTSYRVLDMHVKFAKQFTHYLILFQELENNKINFEL